MAEQIDIREIVGCTCLLARRTTRQLTQIYDTALEPVGLTINQFGVLAHLYGSTLAGRGHLSIGALADRIGKHPSTLSRDLRPLGIRGFVADAHDPSDARVRAIRITARGRAQLSKAIPHWRRAEAKIRSSLGEESVVAMRRLLELSSAKLMKE